MRRGCLGVSPARFDLCGGLPQNIAHGLSYVVAATVKAIPLQGAPELPTSLELVAVTDAGQRLVECAEVNAALCAETASVHDREGSFPFEAVKSLQESGFLAGPVPTSYGGLGVESLHDVMVAMSRLARGDASTAIAANMHVTGAAVITRLLRRRQVEDDTAAVEVLEGLLTDIGAGRVLMCFPTTEPGTDLSSPLTEATPVDGGYLVNGRKIFGTGSPAADLFFPSVRIANGGGGFLIATALITRDTPGLTVEDDWDALGMRASGSNSIVLKDCFVPEDHLFAVRDTYGKMGRGVAEFALTAKGPLAATYLGISQLTALSPLTATYLGVAEAAQGHALQATTRRKGASGKRLADRIPIQELMGAIEIDLAVCRATIERVGRLADVFFTRYATTDPPADETNALMKELQCMKYVVTRKVSEIVDRAMTVCGGMAYMGAHPLSRLYRDARAGPFMQPYSPYEAFEYIGKVTLGLDPTIER
jgi:alkylation response protein AidB-like acyl-CoA dehydrogenase